MFSIKLLDHCCIKQWSMMSQLRFSVILHDKNISLLPTQTDNLYTFHVHINLYTFHVHINWRNVQRHHVAHNAGRVKFKCTMIKWPLQKQQSQHKKHTVKDERIIRIYCLIFKNYFFVSSRVSAGGRSEEVHKREGVDQLSILQWGNVFLVNLFCPINYLQ